MGIRIGIGSLKIGQGSTGVDWSSYWATREPSGLVLTATTDTQIDGLFTINGTGQDGHKVYISDDGVTYTLAETLTGSDNTFSIAELTSGTKKYIKVVAYKGTQESTGVSDEEITISNQVESLISNGTFSSSDDWNPFTDWTISGGAANMAAGTSASLLTQLADDMITSLTESTDYTLAFDIVSSAPGVYFSFVSYDGAIQSTLISGANYTTNSYSINFSTPVGVTGHGIAFLAYGDAAATLDNVVLTIR